MTMTETKREPQPGETWHDKLWGKNTLEIVGRRGQRLTVRYTGPGGIHGLRTLLVSSVIGNYNPPAA